MQDLVWIKEKTTPIAARYGLKRLYVFGSYAKGTANNMSDIDLLYEKGDCLTLLDVSGMLQDFKETLGKTVDLVSVNSLEPEFWEEVYNSMVILYEK